MKPDGHRLRTNVLGRSKMFHIGRLSIWDVKQGSNGSTPVKDNNNRNYIENRGFKPENHPTAFNVIQINHLIDSIDAFIRNNGYSSPFVEAVTEDLAPDYLNVIAVEMNLYTIRDKIEADYYRSKEMVLRDLKLIKENCIEFNDEESKLTKDAGLVYENLKKIFLKAFSANLRNVNIVNNNLQVPRRNTSMSNRENSQSLNHQENFNKRNPQKINTRRNTRQRSEVNYNEDNGIEKRIFKNPTPQKNKRAMIEEDSEMSIEEGSFKINLDNNATGLRRSSRNRRIFSMKGKF